MIDNDSDPGAYADALLFPQHSLKVSEHTPRRDGEGLATQPHRGRIAPPDMPAAVSENQPCVSCGEV